VTTVISVQRAVLKVTYRRAERRLKSAIERGERLKLRAWRTAETGQDSEFAKAWSLWYGACLAALNDIYPTIDPADQIHRAQQVAGTWPMRVQQVIDVLANLKDTLRQFSPPPKQVTVGTWILEIWPSRIRGPLHPLNFLSVDAPGPMVHNR